MKVEKVADRTVKITESEEKTYEVSLDQLYIFKARLEKELAGINSKIAQAEALGVLRESSKISE